MREAACDHSDHALVVEDLVVSFPGRDADKEVLHGVSLCLQPEEILGVVGETGSGKSLTMWSIMGLVPPPGAIRGGSIRYRGEELVGRDASRYRDIRGKEIVMIVQNARGALNPLERVGKQISAVYKANTSLSRVEIEEQADKVLRSVGFRNPARILHAYPHQLSGGMAQRVLIAIALGPEPQIVIADEPTSGLDTTVGVRVMQTLRSRIQAANAAGIVVTHDLGVVANYCDRVILMRDGHVVDQDRVGDFFERGGTEYRRELITAHLWEGEGTSHGGQKDARTTTDEESKLP
jgi:ABC-type dipeptide/oligopeptide/nickel transport system ATPase component